MDLGIRRLFDGTFMDENGIIHPTNPKKTGGASGFEEKLLESFSNKKARPDSEFDLVKFLAYVETCNIDIDTIALIRVTRRTIYVKRSIVLEA